MFLHELSRSISKHWAVRVDGQEYEQSVRQHFGNRCPYCLCDLNSTVAVVEHLDGMNRYRAGLHVPGNVLVACKKCNGEKRRDDSLMALSLATSGWASFLSHNGSACPNSCKTCQYWETVWVNGDERRTKLNDNLERIISFRSTFKDFQMAHAALVETLPILLTKLYSDCQAFAEGEITSLLEKFKQTSGTNF